ncbi:protein bric-a-brac 1-like [Contarinia nasturtii]|uniref:protein bric-a-brac 1-like n=1 Tax=Contarinia nasturtii TaxID=265458 RepID=UPI0012D3A0DE|nr:protein bric-a-brac 1-like [Contarinia nasturtii]
MPDSPQPVSRHSTSPKTPACSPPLIADVKPSPSSKANSPTASPSLPNSWHNAQTNYKPQTTSTPLTSEKSPLNPQQYCLRWNNYTSNLTNVFDQLLHNESFVDVTLACDGKSIKAHKMVLSACSPYFQSLFFENPCQHPIVILRDVKWAELKSVVEFMYKGEINLAHDEIGPLLNVAEMLKIRGLADVKGDHDAIKLEHSSASSGSLPEIIPVAKQPKINASPDWDLNKIDFLMRNVSASSSPSATTNANNVNRNQRKRNWPNGSGTATLANPSNSSSTSNHTISLSSRNVKNNNGNSNSTNNSNNSSLPHTDSQSNDDMEIKPVNPIDGLETRSQSSLSEDLPVDASNTPTPPTVRNSGLNIPDAGSLSSLSGLPHADSHSNDDMEIKPGIAEMIREEERAKLMESNPWLAPSTSASLAESYQYQLQSMWQKCWSTNQNLIHNLRFRERGPLKSWRPETMADAIMSVLKDGLSLSQAARKYDIPYPTFVLYANRVHNMLGPSMDGGTDLRPKGRGRPQRILLGVWPEETIKGVVKTVVFRDAKELRCEEAGMQLTAFGRHSPMFPFSDGQLDFSGGLPNHALNANLPVNLDSESLNSLAIGRCWPSLANQQASSG